MPREEITYNGVVYYRYPESKNRTDRVYFRRGTGRTYRRLHVVIWEEANGPVPQGREVHHQDGNPANNVLENLVCVTVAEHRRLDALRGSQKTAAVREHLDRVRPQAAEWHRSEAGRAWHREHARDLWAAMQ